MYRAQHSTAQHSTAQHSTAQPYLAFCNYCCNNLFRPELDCTTFDFYREKGIESREQWIVLADESDCYNHHSKPELDCAFSNYFRAQRVVLANDSHCYNHHCEPLKDAWQLTKILPLLRGDVSHRLTERFSEQSEIDFQHHSDSYVQNKPFPSRLRSENSITFYGGAIC